MESLDLPTPARALAIGAHPDDIEFGCGGTLAKWAAAGCHLVHLVCTDGSKGTWDASTDSATLVARRHEEQHAAAHALGGGEVLFLDWPDGELESGLRQRSQIAAAIRRVRPDVVLGHDPWKRYRLHPDHRAAGQLTVEGIVAARDPLFFPELALEPHRPSVLLLFEPDETDHYEDISSTFDQKIAALLAHESQLKSTMFIESARPEHANEFIERERQRMSDAGIQAGVDFAEPFKRIDRL